MSEREGGREREGEEGKTGWMKGGGDKEDVRDGGRRGRM